MWPEQLTIVAEMPMTPTRKIIKSELVRRYEDEHRGAPRPSPLPDLSPVRHCACELDKSSLEL